jgi:hypothetical protein
VAGEALITGDCTREALGRYEALLDDRTEVDRRTGELLLTCAKNPDLKDLYLMFLRAVGRVADREPVFQEFCSGIFSGGIPAGVCLSPGVLWDVVPRDPASWLAAFSEEGPGNTERRTGFASELFRNTVRVAGKVARRPLATADWALEVLTRSVELMSIRAALP